MLQRVWRCTIDPDRSGEYEDFARDVSLPMFRAQPGFRGCLMTRRGEDCEVLTLWDGPDAIEALNASASYQATVAKILATGFIRRELGTLATRVHLASLGEAMDAPDHAQ
jgi:heme-degrading monooxygenase HmoA